MNCSQLFPLRLYQAHKAARLLSIGCNGSASVAGGAWLLLPWCAARSVATSSLCRFLMLRASALNAAHAFGGALLAGRVGRKCNADNLNAARGLVL